MLNIHADLYVAINISQEVFESAHLVDIIVVLLFRTGEVNSWFSEQAAGYTGCGVELITDHVLTKCLKLYGHSLVDRNRFVFN